MHKYCPECKQEKSLEEFYKNRSAPDGYQYQCKDCIKRRNKDRYQKNRETEKARSREWKEKNRERAREYTREYMAQNQDKIQAYLEDNKEVVKERKRRWNQNNKDYHRKYQEANRERINEKKREWNKKRCATDPSFKLSKLLRTRLHHALRGKAKNGSAVRDMGCSVEELKRYIESLWLPGMSWENHNFRGWHIDHIRPLNSFNLEDKEELLAACHYTNLRPLWAEENMRRKS